jgi:hypothetical protein
MTRLRPKARHGGSFRPVDARNLGVDGWFVARRAVVDGEFGPTNARIAGRLDLSGSVLRNPGRTALGVGGLTVGGGLWRHLGYAVEGEMRLVGARLGGSLTLTDGVPANPGTYTTSRRNDGRNYRQITTRWLVTAQCVIVVRPAQNVIPRHNERILAMSTVVLTTRESELEELLDSDVRGPPDDDSAETDRRHA